MDPRQNVRPGQRLQIAAAQINALNAMMRPDVGFRSGPLIGYGPLNTLVLARNDTGSDLDRWGVMKITGIEINPNVGDTERRSFEEMPCVTCGSPDDDIANTFVVAIEPIKAGKIGRVAVAGVVQITSAGLDVVRSHVQVLWEDSYWALVRIGGGGSGVRLGRISGTWLTGYTATVTRLHGDGTLFSPSQTFTATNYFTDISVDCGTRKVACAQVDGTWILIAAEC